MTERRFAVAVLLFALAAVGCGSPNPSVAPEGFPTEVLGMPVLSVGGANQLIAQGKLDGRAAAVGGWWIPQMAMGCPAPSRPPAALQGYCEINQFASKPFAAYSCTHNQDGSGSCQSQAAPPDTEILEPVYVDETSNPRWGADGAGSNTGIPLVLVGHANDPRAWNCPLSARQDCAKKFVVDWVAWANGQELPLTPPNNQLQTVLTPAEATTAAGARAIAVDAIKSSDALALDPRLMETGDSVVWLVRTIADSGVNDQDATRAVNVWLIDDATPNVLKSMPLAMTPDAAPATISVQATTAGECCDDGQPYPFYWVSAGPGSSIAGQSLGFPFPSALETRYGPALPTVLAPDTYTISVWRSKTSDIGTSGPSQDECSTQVTLVAGQDVRLEAAFPETGACTFVAPTFNDPLGG